MAAIVDFVDGISASPTTRLDVNDGVIWRTLLNGSDFTPPGMRRSTTSTMLTHGDWVAATAYTNRVVTLELQLIATDPDALAEQLQLLARELERATNILRVWRHGATKPVFFETFRSPFAAVREQLSTHRSARVDIQAKPFALGLKETLSTVVVPNDPATGCYIDIPFPSGDVETPLNIDFAASDVITSGRNQTSIAMRRRGTPANAPWIWQAEDAGSTLAANTARQAFDAAMSGSGQNFVRASSLTGSYVTRITSPLFPAAASVDARGKYRPYLRVRKTNGTGEVRVRLVISPDGTTEITPDGVGVVLPAGTGVQWAEFPVIQIPVGEDPITDGPGGAYLATRGITFKIQVSLTAGTSSLDVDCMVLMPADDRFCRVLWPGVTGPTTMRLDSSSKPKVYGLGSAGETYSTEIRALDSGTPMISPNSYNRAWLLKNTGTTAADVLSGSTTATPWYLPRYLNVVRPVSS